MRINLARKISFFVGMLVLVIAFILGGTSLTFSVQATLKEVETATLQYAEESAKYVEATLNAQIAVLQEVAERARTKSMDWQMQRTSLEPDIERLGYLDFAVVLKDGTAQYVKTGETAQLGDREYVKKALEGKANVSNPILSKVTGKIVIMYAAPIRNNNEVVGVLVARRDGTAFSELVNEIGIGDSGFAFILGEDSTFYAYPDNDIVLEQKNAFSEIESGGQYKDFAVAVKNLGLGKKGIVNYSSGNINRFAALSPIAGTNWTLGVVSDKKDILSGINHLRNVLLLTSFIVILLGIALSFLLGRSIAGPIVYLADRIEKLAKYDLTADKGQKENKLIKRQDEIGAIAKAIAMMQENFALLIKNISATSQQVAASSEELTSTSQQAALSVNEVARTVEEIAKGATDQAKDTQDGATHVNNLGDNIAQNQKLIENLNAAVEKVSALRNKGTEALKTLVEKTNESDRAAEEVHQIIIETHDSAERIEAASQMIKNIADQTNLLALNAAIEAARAGEAGKGFAVVADEIRKLAEQSNSFTDEIAAIINELSQKTEKAVKTMEQVGHIVAEQTQSVEKTNKRFEGISVAIEKIRDIIATLNQSALEMETRKGEIVGIIQNLSAISEENAAGTQEASASVEEQSASMEEIANASEALAKLAEELQRNITRFKY